MERVGVMGTGMQPDPLMIGIIQLDKLIAETATDARLIILAEERAALLDDLLDKRNGLAKERARGFRIRDNRRIK